MQNHVSYNLLRVPTGGQIKAALLQDKSRIAWCERLCSIAENIYRVLVHSIGVDFIDMRRVEDVAKLEENNQALYSGLRTTQLS
jgi:hypothetical protein